MHYPKVILGSNLNISPIHSSSIDTEATHIHHQYPSFQEKKVHDEIIRSAGIQSRATKHQCISHGPLFAQSNFLGVVPCMEQILDSRDGILDKPEISFVTAYKRISVQLVELECHVE